MKSHKAYSKDSEMQMGHPVSGGLRTKRDLAKTLKVSLRMIDNMMKGKKIPFVRITSRCVRFRLPAVMEALGRYEVLPLGKGGVSDRRVKNQAEGY